MHNVTKSSVKSVWKINISFLLSFWLCYMDVGIFVISINMFHRITYLNDWYVKGWRKHHKCSGFSTVKTITTKNKDIFSLHVKWATERLWKILDSLLLHGQYFHALSSLRRRIITDGWTLFTIKMTRLTIQCQAQQGMPQRSYNKHLHWFKDTIHLLKRTAVYESFRSSEGDSIETTQRSVSCRMSWRRSLTFS